MNFYSFHIGDYASATRHLSWYEDAAYRRLLDVYYVREDCLPLDERQIFRLVVATSDEQREAVRVVLEEFFQKTEFGYSHGRCNAELLKMQTKKEKASQSAQIKWRNAKSKESEMPLQSERNANASTNAHANASTRPCEGIDSPCEGNATNTNTKSKPKPKTVREPAGFAEFWMAYPKKVGKGDAEKAFRSILPVELPAILAAIRIQAELPQWKKESGQFIPNPATWINRKQWLDEQTIVQPSIREFVC